MSAAPASSPCRAAARRSRWSYALVAAGPRAGPSAGGREPRPVDGAGHPDARPSSGRRAGLLAALRHDGGRDSPGRRRRCSACRRCSPASNGSTSPSASPAALYLHLSRGHAVAPCRATPLPAMPAALAGSTSGWQGFLRRRSAAAAQQSQGHGVLRQHLHVAAARPSCRAGWTPPCWPSSASTNSPGSRCWRSCSRAQRRGPSTDGQNLDGPAHGRRAGLLGLRLALADR